MTEQNFGPKSGFEGLPNSDDGDLDSIKLPSTLHEHMVKTITIGDDLATAAAYVCSEYDGVHRLRAALAKWFDARADIHGTQYPSKEQAPQSEITINYTAPHVLACSAAWNLGRPCVHERASSDGVN